MPAAGAYTHVIFVMKAQMNNAAGSGSLEAQSQVDQQIPGRLVVLSLRCDEPVSAS
jgi:hypothetical protein